MEVNIKVLRTYFITYKNRNEAIEIAEYLNSIGEKVHNFSKVRTRILAPEWDGFKCKILYGPDGDDIWCLSVYKNHNLRSITWTKFQRMAKLKRIQTKYEKGNQEILEDNIC